MGTTILLKGKILDYLKCAAKLPILLRVQASRACRIIHSNAACEQLASPYILGEYRINGKDNGNYGDHIGIIESQMEKNMENEMETGILGLQPVPFSFVASLCRGPC